MMLGGAYASSAEFDSCPATTTETRWLTPSPAGIDTFIVVCVRSFNGSCTVASMDATTSFVRLRPPRLSPENKTMPA